MNYYDYTRVQKILISLGFLFLGGFFSAGGVIVTQSKKGAHMPSWTLLGIIFALLFFMLASLSKSSGRIKFERSPGLTVFLGGLFGSIIGSLIGLLGYYVFPHAKDLMGIGLGGGLVVGVVLGALTGIYLVCTDSSADIGAFGTFVFMGAIAGGGLGSILGIITKILSMDTSGVMKLALAFGEIGFIVCASASVLFDLSVGREEEKKRIKEAKSLALSMSRGRSPMFCCPHCHSKQMKTDEMQIVEMISGVHSFLGGTGPKCPKCHHAIDWQKLKDGHYDVSGRI
jgi:hypothetical protein